MYSSKRIIRMKNCGQIIRYNIINQIQRNLIPNNIIRVDICIHHLIHTFNIKYIIFYSNVTTQYIIYNNIYIT